jgi:serine/threonine protein kinase
VLVNYGKGESKFKEVQLADFGSTVHMDSAHARDGDSIGTPIFRSPEAHLQMRWDTATDIWSFGAMTSFPPKSFFRLLLSNRYTAHKPALWGGLPYF